MLRVKVEATIPSSKSSDIVIVEDGELNSDATCSSVTQVLFRVLSGMGYHRKNITDAFQAISEEYEENE